MSALYGTGSGRNLISAQLAAIPLRQDAKILSRRAESNPFSVFIRWRLSSARDTIFQTWHQVSSDMTHDVSFTGNLDQSRDLADHVNAVVCPPDPSDLVIRTLRQPLTPHVLCLGVCCRCMYLPELGWHRMQRMAIPFPAPPRETQQQHQLVDSLIQLHRQDANTRFHATGDTGELLKNMNLSAQRLRFRQYWASYSSPVRSARVEKAGPKTRSSGNSRR
jgi:hypothetical protein